MKFLVLEDIKAQCTDTDLDVLSQSSEENVDMSESRAIAFFKGYLTRYDVETIFADIEGTVPAPDTRNPALVMFLIDYILYILYGAQPDRLIPDIRVRRRDEAVKWLEQVQKGNTIPDLPTVDTGDETDINSPVKTGYNTRVTSSW
jgi:hypothetical protein